MADFPLDITTLAAVVGMAGIMVTIVFQIRSFRKDQREKAEAAKEQILAQINDKVDSKLEVIKTTTSGLERAFEEFKSINRQDLINLKEELKDLQAEIKFVSREDNNRREELEKKIMDMYGRIVDLEIKLDRK